MHYGVDKLNVLTGFCFIGAQIKHFQATGEQAFLFGLADAYGYLIKPFVRACDAIQSTVLLAVLAATYQSLRCTLWDGVQELTCCYGTTAECTVGVAFVRVAGELQMANQQPKFRVQQPEAFAGVCIAMLVHFQRLLPCSADGTVACQPMPSSNVLCYILADGLWIAIRPSGLEPMLCFTVGTMPELDACALQCLAALAMPLDAFRCVP